MHLRGLFGSGVCPPALVFVQSKSRARQLYHELRYDKLRFLLILIHLAFRCLTEYQSRLYRLGPDFDAKGPGGDELPQWQNVDAHMHRTHGERH